MTESEAEQFSDAFADVVVLGVSHIWLEND